MNLLSIVMSFVDLSTLTLLTLIGMASVALRILYKRVYVTENTSGIISADVLKWWGISHLVFLVVILILIVLKGVVIVSAVREEALKEEQVVEVKQPEIVKVVEPPSAVIKEVETKVMNKEIFSLCLDKVRTKEGVPVEAIRACTDAALYKVQDVK